MAAATSNTQCDVVIKDTVLYRLAHTLTGQIGDTRQCPNTATHHDVWVWFGVGHAISVCEDHMKRLKTCPPEKNGYALRWN